ncbi:hypothetical protein SAVIM338S_00866 [Streptomyces avidinii]
MSEYLKLCDDVNDPLYDLDQFSHRFSALRDGARRLTYQLGDEARVKTAAFAGAAELLAEETGAVLAALGEHASLPNRDGQGGFLDRAAQLRYTCRAAHHAFAEASHVSHATGPEAARAEAEYLVAWHIATGSDLLDRAATDSTNLAEDISWRLDVADQKLALRDAARAGRDRGAAVGTTAAKAPGKPTPRTR